MRKLITAALAMSALAALVVPSLASADVARYQTQTATFTATQPYGVNHQFDHVWTHTITVNVNPCENTFDGTATITGANGEQPPTEHWTGTFGNGTISYSMTRSDTAGTADLVNGVTDGTTINHPTTSVPNGYVDQVDMKITSPQFSNTSNFKNHGEYVSQQGGGSDAAHSCIGMPIH